MAEPKEKAKIRLQCDKEVKDQLEKIAGEEDRSLSGQIVHFLKKAIKDYLSGD